MPHDVANDIFFAIRDHLNATIYDNWTAEAHGKTIFITPIGQKQPVRTLCITLVGDNAYDATNSTSLANLNDPHSLDYLTKLVNTTIAARHKRLHEIHELLQDGALPLK